MRKIKYRQYKGSSVVLDGKHFVSCTFTDCTYVWNGGEWMAENCRIKGARRFETVHQPVADTIHLMRFLGLLLPEFAENWRDF